MTAPLLIAGSGKMARNIGRFFLERGHPVAWLSRDPRRLADLARRLGGGVRRVARQSGPAAGFYLYGDPAIPTPGIVIETVNESLADKRDVLRRLDVFLTPDALLFSNSSSFLPEDVHPRAVGVHFFYPIELTGFVEVIWPAACPPALRERVLGVLRPLGLRPIEQTTANAFAVNRLLLPVHAECFRALAAGAPREALNDATRSPLLPGGALAFIEAVGPKVMYPSVCNYLRRMPAREAQEYEILRAGLKRLHEQGWPEDAPSPASGRPEAQEFLYLLVNACYNCQAQGMTDEALGLVLRALFQAERSLAEVVRAEGVHAVRARLAARYAETGRSYFAPAADLREER